MAGQYDQYYNQRYVSNYVPMPLDFIAQQGAMKQSQYDNALNETQTSTDPLGKISVAGSLKTYGKTGIEDTDLGFEQRKNQLVTSLNAKREALAEGLASGKIDPRDPSIYQLKKESLAAAQELQGYSEIAKQVKANNDEISKNKDYAKQQYLGNPAIQYNTNFLKELHEGKATSYNPVGLAGYTDRPKEVSDYASKVGEDQLAAYIGTDKRPGYIYEFSKSGKTKDKIESGFDNWYNNSIVKDDIKLDIQHRAALEGTSLDQDISVRIPKYNDEGKFLGTADVKMKYGQYYEGLAKQNLLEQAKTQSTSKIDQSQSTDAWAMRNAEKQDKLDDVLPVYDAPQSAIKGVDYGKAFSIKNVGDNIPYTEKEREEIKKAFSQPGVPQGALLSTLNAGKTSNRQGFSQPSELAENERKFLTSIANFVDKSIATKISNGKELSTQELDKLYPIASQMANAAKQDVEVNSRVVGMSSKESEQLTSSLFGKNDPTVKNLGTGNAGNLKFYDKESNKVMTYKDLKSTLNEDDVISLNGKFAAENPYSLLTGDNSFKNPTQAFIGGKEYIISGPKAYITADTQDANNPKQEQLKRNNSITDIYQSKFSPVPVELDVHNKKVQVYFERSPENPTEGLYKVNYNGQTIQSKEASKIEQFLYNEGKS